MKESFKSFSLLKIIFLIQLINFSLLFAQSNEKDEQIYLRVELSTTSDWTIFKWETLPEIITMRVFAVDGQNLDYQVFYNQIKLAKKNHLDSSKANIFVDYLLRVQPEANWKFSLSKGEIGVTELKVNVKNDLVFENIYSLSHNKIVENDKSENKVFDEIKFQFKPEFKFEAPFISLAKIPKMVLAFYYLWYSKENWKSLPLVDQPENFYSSSDLNTIQRQIKLAKANGIDGFITSWDGVGTYSDKNFKLFLKQCEKLNFKTAIYYETLNDKGPRSDEEIFNSLKYMIENYGNHPSFIKVLDKPLIFIWASNEMDINRWKNIFTRLKVLNLEATFIGMGYDISNLQIFDGLHQYGVILIDDLENEYKILSTIVKNYHLVGEKQKIWTATVQPGYDERKIPNRKGLFKERSKGKYYEKTWKAAVNSNPDLIIITSWNEWWENTHIEPSKFYKNYYLNLTKKYSRLWKSNKSIF